MTKMFNVLLIGDNCTDEYRYGTVDRISPEAPVPVFKFSHMETKPGMAGNVMQNLESFKINVTFITSTETNTKTRLIDIRSKQHILRIDDDVSAIPLITDYYENIGQFDAIVFSDYNKGFINYEVVQWTRNNYSGPIFIDTKKRDLAKFEGCFVKVNEHEYSQRTSECNNLIVTLGANGANYQGQNYSSPKIEVVDVCGAGDTFLSALVSEYLNTTDITRAIQFANRASAITVQHSGVYALTSEDIETIKI